MRGIAILALVLACAAAMCAQPAPCPPHFVGLSGIARPAALMGDGHRVCEGRFLPGDCAVQIGHGRHAANVM
jgi:hypothetical protein